MVTTVQKKRSQQEFLAVVLGHFMLHSIENMQMTDDSQV